MRDFNDNLELTTYDKPPQSQSQNGIVLKNGPK